MAMRKAGSSRNAVTTSFKRRLAARSMAFALGRSIVISRMPPSLTVLIPSDMCAPLGELLQANHRVPRDRSLARRPDNHRVHVYFDQCGHIRRRIARHAEYGCDQRVDVGRRLAAISAQRLGDGQSTLRRVDRTARPGGLDS